MMFVFRMSDFVLGGIRKAPPTGGGANLGQGGVNGIGGDVSWFAFGGEAPR